MTKGDSVYIFRSAVNSFHYLYQDAEFFEKSAGQMENFNQKRLTRTAVILYILSLEALINRALDHFVPKKIHDFVLEREQRFSLQDKWQLLPLLASSSESAVFDTSRYPWSHFSELVQIRNDYVHPKHDRDVYYEAKKKLHWIHLDWKRIPIDAGLKETDVIYRQTKLPRDPYAITLEHTATVKKVVDDTITELDRLLDGRILKENWARSDQMTLIYPPGAYSGA